MNPQADEPQFHLINDEKKKSSHRSTTILLIVSLLLLVAFGVCAYLWWQQKEASSSLQTQLNTANQENQKMRSAAAATPPAGHTVYSAVVGKFTLTLDDRYTIIIDLDGSFEGGPATRLAIGTKNGSGEQTINSATHSRVTVDAYPLASDSYANRVASETADYTDKTKLTAPLQVAGVNGEVYELKGLFSDKKIFFTKNNIVYVITAHNDEAVQAVLDDVIKGFKFN